MFYLLKTFLVSLLFECVWSGLVKEEDNATTCQNDEFEARCRDNHVIMMTSSRYGRMRMGKCVENDYGYIGCGADVLRESDQLCSGRQFCRLNVPVALFENEAVAELHEKTLTNPCPKDFKLYLEASYICIPVLTKRSLGLRSSWCSQPDDTVTLTNTYGVLASQEFDRGIHEQSCSFVLKAEERNVFMIVLWDFGVKRSANTINNQDINAKSRIGLNSEGSISYNVHDNTFRHNNPKNHLTANNQSSCQPLFHIRDVISLGDDVGICSNGKEKTRVVYVSQSNVVEISSRVSINPTQLPHNFLIQFFVTSCLHPPANLPSSRFTFKHIMDDNNNNNNNENLNQHHKNNNKGLLWHANDQASFERSKLMEYKMMIECKKLISKRWEMECVGGRWLGVLPEVFDCPEPEEWSEDKVGFSSRDPLRLTLLAICLIAFLFAICILVAGLLAFKCFKRRRLQMIEENNTKQRHQQHQGTNNSYKYTPTLQQQQRLQQQHLQHMQRQLHYEKQLSFEDSLQAFSQENSHDDKFVENTYSSINEIIAQVAEFNQQQAQQPIPDSQKQQILTSQKTPEETQYPQQHPLSTPSQQLPSLPSMQQIHQLIPTQKFSNSPSSHVQQQKHFSQQQDSSIASLQPLKISQKPLLQHQQMQQHILHQQLQQQLQQQINTNSYNHLTKPKENN